MPQAAPATLSTDSLALDRFLRGVERHALRMAQLALPAREDAFDVVQDAMLAFVRDCRGHSDADWPVLFWRALDRRLDHRHRRRKVHRHAWFGPRGRREDNGAPDPIAAAPETAQPGPFLRLADDEAMASLETALRSLPLRQRQAFLLRVRENLDVARIAQALGVSEATAKNDLFCALRTLRQRLETHR